MTDMTEQQDTPTSPRFRLGDKVTPVAPMDWYERVAGTVELVQDGYMVRYPSGYHQTYAWRELRPATPGELVRYVGGAPELVPADSLDYPAWDEARGVFHAS
jgi:hypothetical protein